MNGFHANSEKPFPIGFCTLSFNDPMYFYVGFSFGGMLACCVCVRLWKSITKQEVLLQRALCITFGQPLLKIKMVEEELRVCPQFEKSIHSIYNMEDYVPFMISCVEFVLPHKPKIGLIPPSEEQRILGDYRTQLVRVAFFFYINFKSIQFQRMTFSATNL